MRSLVTGVVGKLFVFLFWNLLSVGVLVLPIAPLAMLALELVVVAAFVRRYLVRRTAGRRGERARRAVLRLRAVPRSVWGIVGLWIGATIVLDNLVSVVWLRLVPRAADYPNPFEELERVPLGWLPLYATMLVAAPLVEEVAFRGWVQRPLERRVGAAWAIGISALLFALAHGYPLLVPYYVAAGVALGASVYLTRSLWVGVVAHAAHNLWSVASDAAGLTNERLIVWTRDPVVFVLAAGALVAWIVVMVRLGRRMREAIRKRTVGASGGGTRVAALPTEFRGA